MKRNSPHRQTPTSAYLQRATTYNRRYHDFLEPNIPYPVTIAIMQQDLNCTRPEAQFYYHITFQFNELNFDDYRAKAEMTLLRLNIATTMQIALDKRMSDIQQWLRGDVTWSDDD